MAAAKTICIIDGHPDPAPERFIHALCDAYAAGADKAGHTVERIDISAFDVPCLMSAEEFTTPPNDTIARERDKLTRADHLVIAFPLWLGSMPSKTRAFFEQAARADFLLETTTDDKGWPEKMMKGKSARVIVTMGMPGLVYRFAMDTGALKALERGILGLSGFHPIRHSILGGVEAVTPEQRNKWLAEMAAFGADAV